MSDNDLDKEGQAFMITRGDDVYEFNSHGFFQKVPGVFNSIAACPEFAKGYFACMEEKLKFGLKNGALLLDRERAVHIVNEVIEACINHDIYCGGEILIKSTEGL
jgi:hypothetical protein